MHARTRRLQRQNTRAACKTQFPTAGQVSHVCLRMLVTALSSSQFRRALMLVIAAALCAAAGAQEKVADALVIDNFNGVSTGTEEVSFAAATKSVVEGELGAIALRADARTSLALIAQRVYDGRWSLVGRTSLSDVAKSSRVRRRWTVRDVSLNGPDLGKGWELYAAVVDTDAFGTPGMLIDYDMVRRASLVISKPVHVRLAAVASQTAVPNTCFIELTDVRDVNGVRVSRGAGVTSPIDVAVNADVGGEVEAPVDAHAYLIVSPIGSGNSRWVMERNGTRSGRKWTETAVLGRPDLDYAQSFRLQGVISRRPLAVGAYRPEQWAALDRDLCARSAEVIVRRAVEPVDLVIESIDDEPIARRTIEVSSMFQADGSVVDKTPRNALNPNETVWILSRRLDADDLWVVQNLAIVAPNRFDWRAPGIRLAPGSYRLIAIASSRPLTRGAPISDAQWYQYVKARAVRRLSRAITVDVSRAASPKPKG
jgi:hypothetical protein